eukprot:scaffold11486_cov170-Ochromonas_danica.AAC.1
MPSTRVLTSANNSSTTFALALAMRVASFPDLVANMEKSWIRQQLNTPGSAIIAKINLRGTLPKDSLVEMAAVKEKAVALVL